MASRPRGSASSGVPAPGRSEEVDAPISRAYEPSHVIQMLADSKKDCGVTQSKLDRVISDVEKLSGKVEDINKAYYKIQGAIIALGLVLPIFGTVIWWTVGDKINDLKAIVLKLDAKPGDQTINTK